MGLSPVSFILYTVAAGFPAGFQPGVTHTKLTVTASFVNYTDASSKSITFTDNLYVQSGIISMAGLSDASAHAYVLTLTDTGDPFSDLWALDFGAYDTTVVIGAVISGLEFS